MSNTGWKANLKSWLLRLTKKKPAIRFSRPKPLRTEVPRWRRLLRTFGIYLRKKKSWTIHIAPLFFVLLGAGFLLALLSMGGMVKYSESPSFCKSCHIMQPYYDAWKNSKHKDIACVECHYPPASKKILLWKKFQALSQVVKFVTKTYSSKPYAEVEDSSCLRSGCHATRLLEGRIVTERGIKFDHRPHLLEKRRGRRLKCVSCHSQMVMGKHVEVTYDTCYLCHFKGRGEGKNLNPIGGCLGCHDLPKKTFAIGNIKYNHKDFVTKREVSCNNCHIDVISGKGEAKQDRCFTCHNQPEKLARYKDVAFIHENHVTKHNVACFHCHQEMRHGFVENDASRLTKLNEPGFPEEEPSAEGHMGVLRFECSYCHTHKHAGQLEMYTGKVDSLGFPDMPSPMYLANVDCVGCHYRKGGDGRGEEFRGETFVASRKACVKCHGPNFNGIWEETRTELHASLGRMAKKQTAAAAALKNSRLTKNKRGRLASLLKKTDRWRWFVKASRGEHNIYLAADVLRRTNDALDRVGRALKAELPELSADPLISGSFCATLCHPRIGVKVPPETVKTGGKTMPHKMHAGMMGCVQCHVIGAHKKVPPRKGRKKLCKTCHP